MAKGCSSPNTYNTEMTNDPTMRSCGEEWFRINRPTLAGEDIRVSKLYTPQQAWWLEIPVWLLEKHPTAHTNLLCENGEDLGREFFHLRVPIPYITQNRHLMDLRGSATPPKYAIHLSAKPDNLFRDERGVGKIDFSQFVVPSGGTGAVQKPVRNNARHGEIKVSARRKTVKLRHTLLVDFDVWKAIQNKRPVEEVTENDVLRELLGLSSVRHAYQQPQVDKSAPDECPDCVAVIRYSRLCFPRSVIEPLPDDAKFCIVTRDDGTFVMTKREFHATFSNVVQSDSYRFGVNYNYSKVPRKALRFRIDN